MALVNSLIVRIKTGDGGPAFKDGGTKDRIYFSVGTREWMLPQVEHKENQTQTFALQRLDGLQTEDIRAIRLRKTGTEGWKPEWIEVYVNDPNRNRSPFYRGTINFFLNDGMERRSGIITQIIVYESGLYWQAPDFPKRWPYELGAASDIIDPKVDRIFVMVRTSGLRFASTNGDVYFSIGTREWKLEGPGNLFERGQVDTFGILAIPELKMSDIQQIGLRIAGSGSWRPDLIRVWVNAHPSEGEPFFEDFINTWITGTRTSRLKRGKRWFSRSFPQPAPTPLEADNTVTALKVELTTASGGATNGRVYFTIGTREWFLDNPLSDDFKSGATDNFELSALNEYGKLRISDFRKIGLRLESTDSWTPARIRVFINNNTTPFYETAINVTLDGGRAHFGQNWEASDFVWEVPVHCHYVIGQNDSTITPERSKESCAALIENLNVRPFRQGAGAVNSYWTQGQIHFRVVGFTDAPINDADAKMLDDSKVSGKREKLEDLMDNFTVADHLNIFFVKDISSGSNWGYEGRACFVKDTRGSEKIDTENNFRRVAISLAHEIGHYFGLPHICDDAFSGGPACKRGDNKFLMFGDGTNNSSQIVPRTDGDTVHNTAEDLAENK